MKINEIIVTMEESSLRSFEEEVYKLFLPINIKDALEALRLTDNIESRLKQLKKVKNKIEIKLLNIEYTPQRIVEAYIKNKNPEPVVVKEPELNKNVKLIKLADGSIVPKKKGPMPKGAVLVNGKD
jgi:hypothetical protein